MFCPVTTPFVVSGFPLASCSCTWGWVAKAAPLGLVADGWVMIASRPAERVCLALPGVLAERKGIFETLQALGQLSEAEAAGLTANNRVLERRFRLFLPLEGPRE